MAQEPLVVSIKPTKTVVSSVTIAPQTTVSLGSLTNVDATDPDDGETLIYDSNAGKYVVKALEGLTSNNIANINGGSF